MNWIGVLFEENAPQTIPEDWTLAADPAPMKAAYADWRLPGLDVAALMDAAERVLRFPMASREPLEAWSRGPVTLIGDAAHPIYPLGSNGASHAILDARVLAFELARRGDVTGALAAYEAARRPMMTATHRANENDGPDRILTVADERAPNGFTDIDAEMPRAERVDILKAYRNAAGFSPETLNARPSLEPVRRKRF